MAEIDKVIQLDNLLRSRISKALMEARQQGYQEDEIACFLAGLRRFRHRFPFAIRRGQWLGGRGRQQLLAAYVSSLLEQTKYGLMIRDEPTEQLIRETYAANEVTQRRLAKNLLAMQDRSVYAATTLLNLLQQLDDGINCSSLTL